jgi:hypothetical protein
VCEANGGVGSRDVGTLISKSSLKKPAAFSWACVSRDRVGHAESTLYRILFNGGVTMFYFQYSE